MAVTVDENLLIAAGVGVFIPLFIFFIKLIIKFQELNSKLGQLCGHMDDNKKTIADVMDMKGDIREIYYRLDNIERSISRHNNGASHGGSPDMGYRKRDWNIDRENRGGDDDKR